MQTLKKKKKKQQRNEIILVVTVWLSDNNFRKNTENIDMGLQPQKFDEEQYN